MDKSNGITSDVVVTGGNVVYLSGERVSFGPEGVVFRHKRPRSSKMLRSVIPLKDVIFCTSDAISFKGDPSRYGSIGYADSLNGLYVIADNVYAGEDGDGNVVLVNGDSTQFTSEDDGDAPKKKSKKKTKKSSD